MSLVEFVAALSEDALALLGAPGASSLGEAIRQLERKRLTEAHAILIEEIRGGQVLPAQAAARDTLVAAFYRYGRAAREGTAHKNLRLMARIIRNGVVRPDFYADDFLRYAALIEALSRDEIALLAVTYRRHLAGDRGALEWACRDLIARGTPNQYDVFAIQQALLRTGLISMGVINNAPIFGHTSLLTELGRLAELEALDLTDL